MSLKQNEQEYWEEYLYSINENDRPKNPTITAGYAGNPEITDDLLNLYLSGKKCAGSSILEDFLTSNDPIPKVGDYWIYLDSKSDPRCILRTEKVVTHKFKEVPIEISIAEGEGDLTLEYWKRVHASLYTPYLKKWGIIDLDSATIITEFFRIVYK